MMSMSSLFTIVSSRSFFNHLNYTYCLFMCVCACVQTAAHVHTHINAIVNILCVVNISTSNSKVSFHSSILSHTAVLSELVCACTAISNHFQWTPDEDFVLDYLPTHKNIVIGAGFSGT